MTLLGIRADALCADGALEGGSQVGPRGPTAQNQLVEIQRSDGPAGSHAEVSPAETPGSDVTWLRSVLSTPGADAATRLGAAQRLLRLALPDSPLATQAEAAIRDAFRSGDEARVNALVDAIRGIDQDTRTRLPAGLAAALLDAAPTLPGPRRDGLRAAFANLGEDAALVVAEIAADPKSDDARRLTAVWALESMAHRRAAEALVGLLDPRGSSSEAIRLATCDALERLFQRGYGRDPQRWREWWSSDAGGGADDSVVEGLRRRVLDLERRLAEQEQDRDRLVARLAALLGEIYLGLDAEQRQDRTVRLLQDELAAVREHGLDLVDRMLRNFESPGDPLQDGLLLRLDPGKEPRAALRARAIRLLDSIKRPDLPDRAAPFYVAETDPDVLAAYLEVFRQRPPTSEAAFDRTVALLEDPALGEAAARTIVRLGDIGALDAGRMERLRPIAARLATTSMKPEFVRLAGAVAEDAVLDRIESLLRSPDRAMRRAAADVMRQRGRRAALVPVALDEAIYPAAIRAFADPPPSLDNLRQILAWTPPSETAAADRSEVVRGLCASMPTSQMAATDDLLAASGWASEEYRARILTRALQSAAEGNGTALSSDAPPALLVRLGNLLVGSEDTRLLQAVVDRLGTVSDAGADQVRFASAISQQQFDAAEKLQPAAADWLALLERLIDRQSPIAAPLRDEMQRRFRTRLSAEDSLRLDEASQKLQAGARPRPNGPANGPSNGVSGG